MIPPLAMDPVIDQALANGAALAYSVSGGAAELSQQWGYDSLYVQRRASMVWQQQQEEPCSLF